MSNVCPCFRIVILGAGHQAIVSHEALVCTLGSAAVETAVDSTSRLDSSTVLRRGKSRNPSSILSSLSFYAIPPAVSTASNYRYSEVP